MPSAARLADEPADARVDERGARGVARLAAAHARVEHEPVAEVFEQAQPGRQEVRARRQTVVGVVEALEQTLELEPHLGLGRVDRRARANPAQRSSRGIHAVEIGENVRARSHDDRFAQPE